MDGNGKGEVCLLFTKCTQCRARELIVGGIGWPQSRGGRGVVEAEGGWGQSRVFVYYPGTFEDSRVGFDFEIAINETGRRGNLLLPLVYPRPVRYFCPCKPLINVPDVTTRPRLSRSSFFTHFFIPLPLNSSRFILRRTVTGNVERGYDRSRD